MRKGSRNDPGMLNAARMQSLRVHAGDQQEERFWQSHDDSPAIVSSFLIPLLGRELAAPALSR